ncbi:hypothetical protein WJX84_008986 [Apatococcus fuscideae]|uniref:FAD dependent oxidoreductase domain-containing protein n=1 Tax=Apatococcus fuscideae TaxID=2026836 RepID=A0AAW1T629_9CHLO
MPVNCRALKAQTQDLMPPAAASPRVVIVGAGVIGTSIAYYLSLRDVAATVIERASVACAASGQAGGFLAVDWDLGFRYQSRWQHRSGPSGSDPSWLDGPLSDVQVLGTGATTAQMMINLMSKG